MHYNLRENALVGIVNAPWSYMMHVNVPWSKNSFNKFIDGILQYVSPSNDDKDILKESLGDSYRLVKQAALDVLRKVANKQVCVCVCLW